MRVQKQSVCCMGTNVTVIMCICMCVCVNQMSARVYCNGATHPGRRGFSLSAIDQKRTEPWAVFPATKAVARASGGTAAIVASCWQTGGFGRLGCFRTALL